VLKTFLRLASCFLPLIPDIVPAAPSEHTIY